MSEATVDTPATTSDVPPARPKDAAARLADYYRTVANCLPGAHLKEVREWRDAAIAALTVRGMPHRRIEEWKYTDLRSLVREFLPLALESADSAAYTDFVSGKAAMDAYTAVFINGRFRAELSSIGNMPGAAFDTLAQSFKLSKTALKTLANMPDAYGSFIDTASAAFATDGMLIDIYPDAKFDKPLHIVSIAAGNEPMLHAARNQIAIFGGAELTLIESHFATAAHQTFAASQINIGEGAKVKHLRLVNGGTGTHLATSTVEIGAGAAYDPLHFIEGGALTRVQSNIRFAGEGARCHLSGAMLLSGSEHADITLVVDHAAPACESREFVKAVLDGNAHGVFQGKVIVARGAQKTDGRQMAHGLLLSETAEFDAKPELEIYADDVKCNHGATCGALDDDMLFYLRSRGIPEAEAKSLLVLAFVGEIIDQIEDEGLREAMMARASQWLKHDGNRA